MIRTSLFSLALSTLVLVPGCGGGSNNPDGGGGGGGDGGGGNDDGGAIDAAPDAPVADCTPSSGTGIAVELVTRNLIAPVFVTHAHDDRLFVIEQVGRIRIVEDGALLPTPFLDISQAGEDRVDFGGEKGLLGLAFHPDYQENGRFFVHYTKPDNGNDGPDTGDTQIAEYTVSSDPNVANTTERQIFEADQFAANHNGGMIEFGPDGMLYIGLGDGGQAFDPEGNGQDIDTPLGAILRIDVNDATVAYNIPVGNPFVGRVGLDEIWSVGWRNPWRFSFDPMSGDLWVGDVGQNCLEEISVQPAGMGGLNFGWVTKEGGECLPPRNNCNFPAACGDTSGMTDPYFEYAHGGSAASVTGGYLYRGSCIPDVNGWYFFADYEDSEVYALDTNLATPNQMILTLPDIVEPTSFGRDRFGELYITTVGGQDGLYRIVGAP